MAEFALKSGILLNDQSFAKQAELSRIFRNQQNFPKSAEFLAEFSEISRIFSKTFRNHQNFLQKLLNFGRKVTKMKLLLLFISSI